MKGLTVLAASLITFTPLFSDSLTLTNGTRYENILCEDMGSYVLVKLLKRIPSQTDTLTYKFPKSKIARIDKAPIDENMPSRKISKGGKTVWFGDRPEYKQTFDSLTSKSETVKLSEGIKAKRQPQRLSIPETKKTKAESEKPKQKTETPHTRTAGISMLLELPKPTFGVAGYTLRPKKAFGFYGDMRISIPFHGGNKNPNYYDSISQNTFNDPKIDEAWDRIAVNLGITKKVNNELFLYAGAGLSYNKLLFKLDDPLDILGDSKGHYWVKGNESEVVPNFIIGAIIFTKPDGQFGLNVGFHTANLGVDIGVAYSLKQ